MTCYNTIISPTKFAILAFWANVRCYDNNILAFNKQHFELQLGLFFDSYQ